jgi:hypothetical protein
MSIADELRKLQELHATGSLTDDEFARAKAAQLADAPQAPGAAVPAGDPSAAEPDVGLTPQRLRVMQIIAGALILGVVVFLGVVLLVVHGRNRGQGVMPAQPLPVISLMAVAMLAVCGPLAFVIPAVVTKSSLRQILSGTWRAPPGADPAMTATVGGRLMGVRQTTLIVGMALLEGTAFLGCTAYLSDARPFVLAVVGVAVLLMLCKFPTEAGVRAWLERQAEALRSLLQQQELDGA